MMLPRSANSLAGHLLARVCRPPPSAVVRFSSLHGTFLFCAFERLKKKTKKQKDSKLSRCRVSLLLQTLTYFIMWKDPELYRLIFVTVAKLWLHKHCFGASCWWIAHCNADPCRSASSGCRCFLNCFIVSDVLWVSMCPVGFGAHHSSHFCVRHKLPF